MPQASTVSENNKRIAKNTLMLYVKMGVMMLVSLYTSRVVLQTLGVDDFGIYNVVGGVVVLFSFLNAAMSSATQRFLNFELGKGDLVQVGRVFSMSLTVHFVIAGMVLILAETVGLWFLNSELNIPVERIGAANWVYQFSVATTLLGILLVPYNATIIAHERMGFYAWTSIVRALLLLGIVYLLVIGNIDKLILYAGLVFAVNALMQIVYIAYCRRAFPQAAIYKPFRDKKLFHELISFSGWSLFGGVANMSASQGINMVMNIFCGVTVNAAMGIANQVNAAVYQFVSNFQTAFNPQIVKLYSSGEKESFIRLIFRASKISYFMMFLLTLPLLLNMEFVLGIWLGEVPEFAADFTRLTLTFALVDALSGPLWMSVQATGKIRNYQLIVSSFIFANLPLSIFLLWLGVSPAWVLAGKVFINIVITIWRAFYLEGEVGLPAWRFLRDVLGRAGLISVISAIPALWVWNFVPAGDEWMRAIASSVVAFFLTVFFVFLLGFTRDERLAFTRIVHSRLKI